MSGEWVGYWLVRAGLAAAGLLTILATVSSYLLMPALHYDELPAVPTMQAQLPRMESSFGVAVLLLVPCRLTLRGWPFWTQLAFSAAGGSLFMTKGVTGIAGGYKTEILEAHAMRLLPMTTRRWMSVVVGAAVTLWMGTAAYRVRFDPSCEFIHHLWERSDTPGGTLRSIIGTGHPAPFWPQYWRRLLGKPWPGTYRCRCVDPTYAINGAVQQFYNLIVIMVGFVFGVAGNGQHAVLRIPPGKKHSDPPHKISC